MARAEAITKVVIDAAQAGDLMACKIILDRLIPPAKERPVNVDLPPCIDAAGVAAAQSAILHMDGGTMQLVITGYWPDLLALKCEAQA